MNYGEKSSSFLEIIADYFERHPSVNTRIDVVRIRTKNEQMSFVVLCLSQNRTWDSSTEHVVVSPDIVILIIPLNIHSICVYKRRLIVKTV